MKTNITTFALMAVITSSAFAALKAPMPEFKNEKQLAEWRAGKATQATSQGYAKDEPAFYTGKPYLASSGNYAFKYRSYNPEIARWTTEDPSGFPDGANSHKYAVVPTSEIDFMGLWRIIIVGVTTDQKTLSTTSGLISATASITATGVTPVAVKNTNQFLGFESVDLSGWGGAVLARPDNPDGDRTVNAFNNPLMASLGYTSNGSFTYSTGTGSNLEQSGALDLGIGMSIRIDSNNPDYCYVKTTSSAAYNGSGLTGMGVSIGPVGVSASWTNSTGAQRPVGTIELQFQIVE